MAEPTRNDGWTAGDNYERYMGRWSRKLAPVFIDWLGAAPGLDWLDVGCGTGALTAAILAKASPRKVLAIDPSTAFLDAAARINDPKATFAIADADRVPAETGSMQVAVSGLVLNFVPDIQKALGEMRRAVKPGGVIGFYVWDYPGGGMEFISRFWRAAASLDARAAEADEARRFPGCTLEGVRDTAIRAGLTRIETSALEIDTVFENFDDYWEPFTLGTGPAPGYAAKLDEAGRSRLQQALATDLAVAADCRIDLRARAWAVKATNG
jgi:SAM-dependent methyltransferase